MKLMTTAVGLILAVSLLTAAAQTKPDTRTPVQRYRGATQYALIDCGLDLWRSNAAGAGTSGLSECIDKHAASSKVALQAATETVSPAAGQALREYHVIFLTALRGLEPNADERKISYEQRQASLKDRLNEAWARFEIAP